LGLSDFASFETILPDYIQFSVFHGMQNLTSIAGMSIAGMFRIELKSFLTTGRSDRSSMENAVHWSFPFPNDLDTFSFIPPDFVLYIIHGLQISASAADRNVEGKTK